MSDRVPSPGAEPAPSDADESVADVAEVGQVEIGTIASGDAGSAEAKTPSVAARIARRTTDLLAIAIVAAGLLTVSGRLRDWWGNDPDSAPSAWQTAAETVGNPLRWGDDGSPLQIHAGDLPVSLERQRFDGSADEVETMLQDRCEAVLVGEPERDSGEVDRRGPLSNAGATVAERLEATQQRFLQLIRDVAPVRRGETWSIYRVARDDSQLPGCTIVGVRHLSERREGATTAVPAPDGTADRETADREVVCWGLCLPEGSDQRWTVWFFAPRDDGSSAELADTNAVRSDSPVPPLSDASTVMSLRTAAGEELVTLHGIPGSDASAGRWMQQIDQHLSDRGWQCVRNWHRSEQRWSARFEEANVGVPSDRATSARAVEFLLIEGAELRLTANVISLPTM